MSKTPKKPGLQFSFNNVVSEVKNQDSPNIRSTSVKVDLKKPREPLESSVAGRSIEMFARPLRSLDNKLFDNKRMTSTHLKVLRKPAPDGPCAERLLARESMLPCIELDKKGIRQSVLNEVALLLLVTKKLQTLRHSPHLAHCLDCAASDTPDSCRQMRLFSEADSGEFMAELERFSIGSYFKHDFKTGEQHHQQNLLSSLDYLLNNSCREPNFAKAVKQLLGSFNRTNLSPSVSGQSRVLNTFGRGGTLAKSAKLGTRAKGKSLRKNRPNAPKKVGRKNQANFKRVSVAESIQFMKNSIFGDKKNLKRRPKRPAKRANKQKAKQQKAKAKIKINRRAANKAETPTPKDFSKKLMWWYIGRRIDRLKTQFSSAANREAYRQFCQNLLLDRFSGTRVILIDCRFKYEFDGGHVRGAFNICNPEVVRRLFFNHGWVNAPEFLDHINQFRDSHLDLAAVNHILAEYEKKLLVRITRKHDEMRPPEPVPQPKSRAIENLFLNGRVKPDTPGPMRSILASQRQFLSSPDSHSRPGASRHFTFDLQKQQRLRLEQTQQKKRALGKDRSKSERSIIKLDLVRNIILRAEKRKDSALVNGESLIGTLISNKHVPAGPGRQFSSRMGRRSQRLQSKTFEVNGKLPPAEDQSGAVIVFYCEFSSRRAPKMFNYFRNLDRLINNYPNLHYPHIYLMKGGYEKFVEASKYFCTRPVETPAPGLVPTPTPTPSVDRLSDHMLAPKLGSLQSLSDWQSRLTASQRVNAKLKSRMLLRSSNVISEKSCEVNEFLSRDDEYAYDAKYNQSHNLVESLVISNPFFNEGLFGADFVGGVNSRTFQINASSPKVRPARHVKHKSMQFDHLFARGALSKSDRAKALKTPKSRPVSASKRMQLFRKQLQKKPSVYNLSDLKKRVKGASFMNMKKSAKARRRRKPKPQPQPQPARLDNKSKLKDVFDGISFKVRSSLVSKLRLKVPKSFKTPFVSGLKPWKPKHDRIRHRAKARVKTKAKAKTKALRTPKVSKRSKSKAQCKSVKKRPRKIRHKKVKSSMGFAKEMLGKCPNLKLQQCHSESHNSDVGSMGAMKTISVDRYRKMTDPKFKNHYISANKQYKMFWMETSQEEKRNRYNRALSVQ